MFPGACTWPAVTLRAALPGPPRAVTSRLEGVCRGVPRGLYLACRGHRGHSRAASPDHRGQSRAGSRGSAAMFPGLYLAYRDARSSLLLLLPWTPQPPALPLPARETPFSFSIKVPRGLRQAGRQPASPTEGASSAADVLRDVIWHVLLRPAPLREGWGYTPAVFGGGGPRSGEGPRRVSSRSHQAFWWLPLGCLFPRGS